MYPLNGLPEAILVENIGFSWYSESVKKLSKGTPFDKKPE